MAATIGGFGRVAVTVRRLLRLLTTYWWMALLIVLATAGAGAYLMQRLTPSYQSSAAIIVLAPGQGKDARGVLVPVNPFAALGSDGQVITAHALVRIITAPDYGKRFLAGSSVEDVTVAFQPDGGGAIVDLATTARTPQVAAKGLSMLIEDASQQLQASQSEAGAPKDSRFTLQTLTPTADATALGAGHFKVLVVVAALGAGAVLLGVFGADYVSTLNRRRRRERRLASSGAEEGVSNPQLPLVLRLETSPASADGARESKLDEEMMLSAMVDALLPEHRA